MSESAGKRREIYVENPMGESKTCQIHGPSHSSDQCKFLRYFGSKYGKSIPTKYHGRYHVPINKVNSKQENNAIVNSAADEILLHENQKVSAAKESPEILSLIFMRTKVIILKILVLKILNEMFNGVSMRLNENLKIHIIIKIRII